MEKMSSDAPNDVTLEAFIPVTRFALIKTLAGEARKNGDKAEITSFFQFLGQWRHQEHQDRLLRLKERYLPFSPDRDTVKVLNFSEEELDSLQQQLIDEVSAMLERANYSHIDDNELDRLLSTHSAYGLELKVDRQEYDEILIYYRGSGEETLEQRDWRNLFRKKVITVPIFKRLFLLLKLKPLEERVREIMAADGISEKKARKVIRKNRKRLPKNAGASHVYLKLFKNIPQEDLEMMFPNTQVQFKLLDKLKLGMTAGGGTIAGVAGTASKAMAAVASANPIALASSMVGLIGVIVRQVMNFFNTRNKYMLALSQRLYFHSLADNRGALTLLSDRGEEEDVKEELLLYYFLYRNPLPRGELHTLDANIETFLAEQFKVKVDFDIGDALQRLERDGIVNEDGQGRLNALAPAEACRLLEQKWRNRLSDMNGWISEEEFSEV